MYLNKTKRTIFDVSRELDLTRSINGTNDYFAVCYQSKSNRSNCHYVILRSDRELQSLKAFHSEYDYQFTKLAI